MARMRYEVIATPAGAGWWTLEVLAISRVTQARNTREIVSMAQDLIEIMTGEGDAEVDITYALPAGIADDLALAAAHLAEADARA